MSWTPKKSVLHKTISAIQAATWEAINRAILTDAHDQRIEPGKVVRLDSTVTAALMHDPSDSSLLWDAVRVMIRLLNEADALSGGALVWRNHRRAAKKRARAIQFTRGRPGRVQHYRELITQNGFDHFNPSMVDSSKRSTSLRLVDANNGRGKCGGQHEASCFISTKVDLAPTSYRHQQSLVASWLA